MKNKQRGIQNMVKQRTYKGAKGARASDIRGGD